MALLKRRIAFLLWGLCFSACLPPITYEPSSSDGGARDVSDASSIEGGTCGAASEWSGLLASSCWRCMSTRCNASYCAFETDSNHACEDALYALAETRPVCRELFPQLTARCQQVFSTLLECSVNQCPTECLRFPDWPELCERFRPSIAAPSRSCTSCAMENCSATSQEFATISPACRSELGAMTCGALTDAMRSDAGVGSCAAAIPIIVRHFQCIEHECVPNCGGMGGVDCP